MPNKLQSYFPIIRERESILSDIRSQKNLSHMFNTWAPEKQNYFLDICTGVRGIKLLYDAFFKEIMNPENTPERMNEFLSLLLKKEVKILYVLPNDSTRIADESSLLITDMVVELEGTGLANIEVQKIGYKFPGQRSACYSSDLLLRQYKRVRSQKKKAFSYKDIQAVYTILLYEKSPKEFHQFPNDYIHFFQQQSNTGLKLELLQKYFFISLDIFQEIQHNKPITNLWDAWLTFFSTDDPEQIIHLIEAYPNFKPMYQEAYQICRNMEAVMGIFSEELRELDRNTVQLMIDEMQEEKELLEKEKQKVEKEMQEIEKEKQKIEKQNIQAKEEATQAKEEATQAKEEATQAKEEATQAKEEATQAKEEAAQAIKENAQLKNELATLKKQFEELKLKLSAV